jgi:hypothetical protein
MGTVEIDHKVKLPSDQRTVLSVPMAMDWKDVAVITALVALHNDVPYDVDGKVSLGGDLVHVSLPFRLSDVITAEQLLQAIAKPPPP